MIMQSHPHHHHVAVWGTALLLLGLTGAQLAAAAREHKCWTGADGVRECGDLVPPGQGGDGVSVYGSGGGKPIRQEAPTPTAEDLERVRLEGQAQAQARTQHEADDALRAKYRSEAELNAALGDELATLDRLSEIDRSNMRQQELRLDGLRAKAADLERAGQMIPPDLGADIDKADRSIRNSQAAIQEKEARKAQIRHQYAQKIERLRQLSEATQTTGQAAPR
ncbi:hypothetical protein [Candidatus Thiodictyon syntrophicum]|jgi:hypothetical protein|uniref:DUF4124 domain-containing protein n=1 Tax=Candidatus Thiodictyon syntrophicum TaxID=1166950 RepID=A0A2K8U9X8_9GAMM|nr:hypothetical protein [Candidatus Thiodictyon syntrophicum]AUB82382.1 hypothetical protein THSYN_16480 [Candidatus Thiodictyon syntrophicum]